MNQPRARTQPCAPKPKSLRGAERAFTLVELMVAVTGGLFVSLVVFAMAREGSRFYQRESRVAEATFGSIVGFDRLHNDIARAGFLSSPNVRSDPTYCAGIANLENVPLLRQLASIQVTTAEQSVLDNPTLKAASPAITPHSLLLAGAYDSVERYDNTITTEIAGGGYYVRLQVERGALFRMGFNTLTAQQRLNLLARLFPPRRVLRLQNTDYGSSQYGIIVGTGLDANNVPQIQLTRQPALILGATSTARCSARFHQQVNVVNFIRYALRKVKGNSDYPNHQQLFEGTQQPPGEDNRLELVREELYPDDGTVIPGSREVVTEYAVDLRFQATCRNAAGVTPALVTDNGADCVTLNVAAATASGAAGVRPQSIRSLRARLSIRSREADRDANVDQTNSAIAPGLYRVGLGTNGTKPFARVRTLQADTLIASQSSLTW